MGALHALLAALPRVKVTPATISQAIIDRWYAARERYLVQASAAALLAQQMAAHAYCDSHPTEQAQADCPFCADRAAYEAWLAAGGHDYRPAPHAGQSVSLDELRREHEGDGSS
ncbi:hypothetical protein [Nonomuraea sp. NPDC023979]|uniref:hypothetical protein n=1 Tax=Nonomuraea sp. NPDC023979 TaxID=3154796 RepID=UPI00340358A7